MQPYFFPYLGYFGLINYSDQWIVFDTVQYIRRGWINRNRILHPNKGWQYITVPLKKYKRETAIKDIVISDSSDWRKLILGQILHYKKYAPYFKETFELVNECLVAEEPLISKLNLSILDKICRYIKIPFQYSYFSEMDLHLEPINGPDEWAIRISHALGATEYVNPPGGQTLYDAEKFEKLNIKLTIQKMPPIQYQCKRYEYVPHLSIIYVLMWNSPEDIKAYLDKNKKNGSNANEHTK
jgi:hypothetical protein